MATNHIQSFGKRLKKEYRYCIEGLWIKLLALFSPDTLDEIVAIQVAGQKKGLQVKTSARF
jgi:hypothetical protein